MPTLGNSVRLMIVAVIGIPFDVLIRDRIAEDRQTTVLIPVLLKATLDTVRNLRYGETQRLWLSRCGMRDCYAQ